MTWKRIILFVRVLAYLSIGWYLLSPLLINQVVNEEVIPLSTASSKGEPADSPSDQEVLTEQEPEVMTASFQGADSLHNVSGTLLYYKETEEPYLRFEDFESTNGPDLYVYLVKQGQDTKDGLSLGELKGNIGNQNYPLPEGVTLEDGDSIVIWCKQFDVDFGFATVEKGE